MLLFHPADFKVQVMSKVVEDFSTSDMISAEQTHYAAMWLLADKLLTSPGLHISKVDLALSNGDRVFLKRSPVSTFYRGGVIFNSRAHATFAATHAQQTRRGECARATNTLWRVLGY